MIKSRLSSSLYRLVTTSTRSFTTSIRSSLSKPLPQFHSPNAPFHNPRCTSTRSFSSGEHPALAILLKLERERQADVARRRAAGEEIDPEEEEDLIAPLMDKIEKEKIKYEKEKQQFGIETFNEPTDSDSDDDDERFTPEAIQKKQEQFEKKFKRHEELLDSFVNAETFDAAFKCMNRINKFEEKHFKLRLEYRVIGELMNKLKVATGKDKFLLQHKLNRAMRLVEWREAYDPNDPANYGVIQNEDGGFNQRDEEDEAERDEFEADRKLIKGAVDDDDMEFDDMKERDDILLQKLSVIDKQLEQKLADLDHTFGKKGKVLEEEIRDLAEERNSLIEKKRKPLYRKGFDVKLIGVNRTCKVTKGGQVIKYSALLACGNYHGVVGYAKAKGPAVPVAIQKAHEKCFQNLHYVERHEEHTIAHAIQTSYKKTKVYLWPGQTQTGMKAGKTVQTILHLAGFKNVKSKVIGSRNPYNTVKAVFQALNAIETPKDVQEKFGRTVVESYLL